MKKKISLLIIGILFICSFAIAQNTIIDSNGIIVNGTIESTNGGVVFPDTSTQTSSNPALEVYDNNNQFLGLSIGREQGGFWIYVPSADEIIYISHASGDTFTTNLLYTTTNCSGTPNVFSYATYSVHRLNNSNEFYLGEQVAPTIKLIKSFWNGLVCTTSNSNYNVVPAISGSPPFSLPVSLPLHFQFRGSH